MGHARKRVWNRGGMEFELLTGRQSSLRITWSGFCVIAYRQILLRPVPETGPTLLILATGLLWLNQRGRRENR